MDEPMRSPDATAVDTAAAPRTTDLLATAPPWVSPMIRQTIWRIIGIGLGTTVLVLMLLQARSLVSMLVIALFFGIAMDPAVTALHARRGWPRGRGTAVVFIAVVGSVILLFAVLIPAIVQVAGEIADRIPQWISDIEATFGISLDIAGTRSGEELESAVAGWAQDNAQAVLGLASTGVGAVFQFFTIAMFTFYFAADAPRIRRTVLRRLPPQRQQRVGWAWDTAIAQTGGYFYSRLLLMIINGGLFFVVLIAVGVSPLVALPLAVFEGFVAEFIPAIGTYLGAAVPLIVVLGTEGGWQALVVVVWTVIYQQVENYWLSPKISARTMELNGGVAFGSALAGGAIAGPMGAFMALPVAALITSFLSQYTRTYDLTYQSSYDRTPGTADTSIPVAAP